MKKFFLFLLTSLLTLILVSCNLPSGGIATPSLAFPTISTSSATTESTPAAAPASATPDGDQTSATQAVAVTQMPVALEAGRYAVIMVAADDVLNIRSAAGTGQRVTGQFSPAATDIQSTGQTAEMGENVWLQVENPVGGTGWVSAFYLTEYVTPEEFCTDARVNSLLDNFKQAILNTDGDLLGTLVSPTHGLELLYWRSSPSVNYSPQEASWVFNSTYDVNWGAGPSGMDDFGTFREYPLPALQDVLNNPDYEQQCNDVNTVSMYMEPWPEMYKNVNFYALYKPATPDVDLDWATWLAGVEYVNGEPYLFALIRFVWEP